MTPTGDRPPQRRPGHGSSPARTGTGFTAGPAAAVAQARPGGEAPDATTTTTSHPHPPATPAAAPGRRLTAGEPTTSRAQDGLAAGRITASRRELAALVAWHHGCGAAGDPVVARLQEAGLIAGGSVHPALRPVVAVLADVRARAVVRSWRGERRPVAEVLVGPAGVLVLPGGHEPDAPQALVWHPRAAAAARVLAGEFDITACDGPPPFDPAPRPWSAYLAAACEPDAGISLVDLRWSARPGAPVASALVVAWCDAGGAGEMVPASADPALLACQPRHPVELWTTLTRLTRLTGSTGSEA